MNDVDSSERNEEAKPMGSRFRSMEKSELEKLAVSAMREHRRLLAADEAVYEEWTLVTADQSVSSAVLKSLQDEHMARQKKSEAQQEELSDIIDALGYIPDVPLDGDE